LDYGIPNEPGTDSGGGSPKSPDDEMSTDNSKEKLKSSVSENPPKGNYPATGKGGNY
jgi:hypothetical protein